MTEGQIRYDPVAVATFRKIWGPDFLPPFPRLPETSDAMAPISAAQGAVFSDPTLDLKTRTVIVFTTLVALGFQPRPSSICRGCATLAIQSGRSPR